MSEAPPDESNPAPKPPRRPRYRGTHPRRFEQRYKEQDPSRFPDEVAKIRAQGRTPAGTHVPIMVPEIFAALELASGARGLDATLGFGGHAAETLARIGPNGFLFAFDRDPIERPKTEARLNELGYSSRFEAIAANFRDAATVIGARGALGALDFVLADFGVSSMQLDDPTRGFSKKVDGPLDLRMNPAEGEPASAWLAQASEADIARALREHSDEPRAERLAVALVVARKAAAIRTTGEFRRVLEREVASWPRSVREREADGPVVRAFQALRIEVNAEFEALDSFLEALPRLLKPGGRVAILSFHSGEDRRVKKAFQAGLRSGVYSSVAPDPVRASPEEVRANPRSRSAKLRWAERAR